MSDKEILTKVQEYFENEYNEVLKLMDRKPFWFSLKESVDNAVQRCLGVAMFVQNIGVKYDDLNCYDEIHERFRQLLIDNQQKLWYNNHRKKNERE